MAHGSLFDYLSEARNEISWAQKLQFSRDIAAGLMFLHTTTPAVLHRDLKSANVLLGSDLVCKISDFGTVSIIAPFIAGRVVTNPRWQAPEVIRNLPYGPSSDVYSFGILLCEVAARQVPFTDKPSYAWAHNVEDDVCAGARPPVNRKAFPPLFCNLMEACWAAEAETRPTFVRIVQTLAEGFGEEMFESTSDLRKPLAPKQLVL